MLAKLAVFDLPPLRVSRPSKVLHVFYEFSDALGRKFGYTQMRHYNCKSRLSAEETSMEGISYWLEIWYTEIQAESSNFKVLYNLVESTEEEAAMGRLSH